MRCLQTGINADVCGSQSPAHVSTIACTCMVQVTICSIMGCLTPHEGPHDLVGSGYLLPPTLWVALNPWLQQLLLLVGTYQHAFVSYFGPVRVVISSPNMQLHP